MEKHAILLVRVSSIEQDYNAQIYDLKLYAKSLGFTTFHIIETKETAFADLSQKVGTNAMFKFIEENPEYNTILMTEISRLARRQSILHSIKEWCLSNQVQIYIKDLDFKLLDESGKINQQAEITFTLYGLFAEGDVKQKLERFTRKRKELMQIGLSISGKLLFGYDRFQLENKKNTLVINEDQATIIRTIYNWYLNGFDNIKNPSIKAISLECIKRGYHKYTHSKRNVNKLLKEEGYTGNKITNNKRKNPKFGVVSNENEYLISKNNITYPVIIEKEIFNQVQLKLKSNIINSDKETKHITLLSKLIRCPSCGRKLQGNYRIIKGVGKNSYRCTSRGDTYPCTSPKSLSMNMIDSAVWSMIKADLPALSKKINEINPDEYLVEMDNQLLHLNQRESEINDNIVNNVAILKSIGKSTNTNIIELITSTGKKIEKLNIELSKIEQEKSKIHSNRLLIHEKQSDVQSVINNNLVTIEASKELLKKYINTFVHSIHIVEHNKTYTILQITIRDYTFKTDYVLAHVPVIKDFQYIILDKTITRNVKGAFFVEDIIYSNDQTQQITFEDAIPIIKAELKSNEFEIAAKLNYQRLNF